jgi:membrane-associated phospholipid phosphatase
MTDDHDSHVGHISRTQGQEPVTPIEDRLAERLSRMAGTGPGREAALQVLQRVGRVDHAAYRAVAGWSLPALDAPLREVSSFANYSKPWIVTAVVMAGLGGPRGRRAALTGLAAIAVTSLVVNQPMKLAGKRRRPDREGAGVPSERWVSMPGSTSFPSGHSASAAAFAVAVGNTIPALRVPLSASAVVVAFSRVYTGVHYPADVLVGASVGALAGRITARVGARIGRAAGVI